MRRAIFPAAATVLLSMAGSIVPWATASAQEAYSYQVTRTHTLLINWRPEEKTYQRSTLSVSPLHVINNGIKFDFEYELPRPGHWFATSIVAYVAPPRDSRYGYWQYDGNNRSTFNSSFDDYNRMWGIGTSAFFKNTFNRRGWYFSTGVVVEFFRVGVKGNDYIPYTESGLTFYDYGRRLDSKSYLKPTLQINIGKHIAISERCYFDLYAGLGLSHSFYKDEEKHLEEDYLYSYYRKFSGAWGFAYRGFVPVLGFRFGVLMWKAREATR